jgi:hypothetical protein
MLSEVLAKWEGSAPPQEMVARHNEVLTKAGLTRESATTFSVRSGFDIEITIEPTPQPTSPESPTPVVPVPLPPRDDTE